jgi:SAM-dependent methyltransferase
MPETPIDIAQRIAQLAGGERLLIVTPGPHGPELLPRLVERFASHPLTVLDSALKRLTPIAAEHPSLACVRGTATRLPFKRHSFEAIFSFESLYAIRPPWTTLAEFHRTLVPNGKLILMEPLRLGVFSALRDKISGPGKRVFSLEEVKFRLARGDYGIEKVESHQRTTMLDVPSYCVCAIKLENPAEPAPQFLTAKEMLERRKKIIPQGEQLP